jgi:NAD+ diphosphatase
MVFNSPLISAALPFAAPGDFIEGIQIPEPLPERSLWFMFRGNQLLVVAGPPSGSSPEDPRAWPRPSSACVPVIADPGDVGLATRSTLYLGRLGDKHCFAANVDENVDSPEGYEWYRLRALFGVLDDVEFSLAGRARQLVQWDLSHCYCGRCGSRTEAHPNERSRVCCECNLAAYPRLAPAVMVLVRKLPNRILLARGAHFPSGMYSALAGFVDPGESLEQCVRREVFEEVGVSITNLRYFASQPWPFPHSLMIAYIADWFEGEITIDGNEIVDAGWYSINDLPIIPSPISIARRLIDYVCQEMTGVQSCVFRDR